MQRFNEIQEPPHIMRRLCIFCVRICAPWEAVTKAEEAETDGVFCK
jgi:hypothetical protein